MSLIPIPLDFFTCAATLCPHQEIFQSDEVLLWDLIPHQSFSDFSKNILCPQLALYNNECRHRGCAAWGKKKQQFRLSLYWQPMIRKTDIRILVSFPPVSHLSFNSIPDRGNNRPTALIFSDFTLIPLECWPELIASTPVLNILHLNLNPSLTYWLPSTQRQGRRPGFSAYFHTNRICPGSFIFPLLVRKVVKFLTITTCQFKWMNGKHLASGSPPLLSSNIDCWGGASGNDRHITKPLPNTFIQVFLIGLLKMFCFFAKLFLLSISTESLVMAGVEH